MAPDSLPIKLRRARGSMTLSQAAARAEISEARIREYEDGSRHPYAKTLKKLAAAYGCTVSDLLDSARNSIAVRRAPARRPRHESGANATVPIVMEPGKEIRLVIEVVLRPAAAEPAAERPVAEEIEPPRQPAEIGNGGAGGYEAQPKPLPEALRSRGRRVPSRRFAGEPFSKDGDALVEFRRAYREFRERK